MSIKEKKLINIEAKIRVFYQCEKQTSAVGPRLQQQALRWVFMLYHELVRDDLTIRAESLSYFTLFSLMPLIAGIFLLLGFFSQWAPVQDQFQQVLTAVLQPIPDESREHLLHFILKFKDGYLQRINEQSASIGIFALGVLIWIVAKVFMNMEDLMNRIWSVNENRSWRERFQNFVFSSVMFPLICIVALSLPGVVAHFSGNQAKVVLAQILPFLMVFFCLSFIFRYMPNVRVFWKSAFCGAGFSCLLFLGANFGLKYYFRFGTSSGYGKAVILPIFAFFIYVEWLVLILGAEVSYLIQNQERFQGDPLPISTLGEAALLNEVLNEAQRRFHVGAKPIEARELVEKYKVPLVTVMKVLDFLVQKNVLACLSEASPEALEFAYVLVRSVSTLNLGEILKEFLEISKIHQSFDVLSVLDSLSKK